jgi:hypothetical protein
MEKLWQTGQYASLCERWWRADPDTAHSSFMTNFSKGISGFLQISQEL